MDILPQKAYLHALRQLPELSYKYLKGLASHFNNDYYRIYKANIAQLLAAGLPIELANKIGELKQTFDINRSLTELRNKNIEIITYTDCDYPELLKKITDPPLLLYYRGTLNNPNDLCLAVVGSRKISSYGKAVTAQITEELANHGIIVVSGLAYGVDACAHKATLEIKSRTIAVVASGLRDEDLYPKEHVNLANEIINHHGLLISEYPPGTPALKQYFIARNRIISGLSVGTLVVECAEKSGALITARYALEQNRNVYAVPGSIYNPVSNGPNLLIKQGAVVVTSSEDILTDLNIKPRKPQPLNSNLSVIEQQIIANLANHPQHMNELVKKINNNLQEISSSLTMLELHGWISKNNSGIYEVIKKT